jgi:hypothetical protein
MESLLEQAKAKYDLTVVDTPSLTAVSDAFPLLRKVDGVIIVGRVGRNRRYVAQRLHETLTGAGAPTSQRAEPRAVLSLAAGCGRRSAVRSVCERMFVWIGYR